MQVRVEKNENNHYRGLHVVVINRYDGSIEAAKVFDTYSNTEKFDQFIKNNICKNQIVAVAAMDDCVTKLS